MIAAHTYALHPCPDHRASLKHTRMLVHVPVLCATTHLFTNMASLLRLAAAGLAQRDVHVVAAREDARVAAAAAVLFHDDAVLILKDGRQHEPVVLHVLRDIVLLVQAVVARGADLHVCITCYRAVSPLTTPDAMGRS